jgi:cystathionine gamma-synthase
MPTAHRSHLSRQTLAVTAGRPEPVPNAPLGHSVLFTSTYAARPGEARDDDLGYGRWANPTWTAFETALGALEGGTALLFASGMAAVSAVLARLPYGGVVVAPEVAYSGTLALLAELQARGAAQVRRVPVADTEAVLRAVRGLEEGGRRADLLWLESPTNPLLEVADLPALVAGGRAAGALVAVDNTFATPLGQRPLEHGADVVVHSVTKYLSGHSDVVLGATVAREAGLCADLRGHRTLHGSTPGPMAAMLALRGLRTLHLRRERACANAAELARRLEGDPRLVRVRYPGLPADPGHERAAAQLEDFGAIVSIEVAGGAAAAEKVCAATTLWVHATSLGGVESSLERRRRHSAEPDAVPANLVRLSVGIEDVEDLWADLDQALDPTSGERAW